ncbi:hypothetical protein G4G28_12560 [Massilia sp. Dwa41.01b]|uniref:cache domain-containing protein n=1 Tax=Massilia sp. Dwa41.01b TaxID=2709302 RepID=UPI001601CE5A|nr:cache domain-containing protein [Massilia sp. Dwa41.01b]QNA89099.1 hypothetical protein G4G28_12560 [Massilia sp. Dwa41.01b]
MQIRAYLYLMAAAILVPVILFAGFTLRLLDDGDSARARDGLARKAERIALLVDDELSDAGAALRVLAASPSLARGDLAAFHREAGLAVGGASSWAMLIGLDGEEIVNTLAPLGTPLAQAPAPTYLQDVLASTRPTVIDVVPGRVAGRLITAVALPAASGAQRYVVAAGFGSDHFRRMLAEAGLPRDWQIDLVDRGGKLIASSTGSAETIGQDAPPALLAAAAAATAGAGALRSGALGLPMRSGARALAGFSRAPRSGWLVAVSAPPAALATDVPPARRDAALAFVAALACAAIVAAWFVHNYAAAIATVREAVGALGRGEAVPVRASRIVEIDRLLAALRQAGGELRRAQTSRESAGNERQSLLEREQHARHMAEEENRAKDQFWPCSGTNCATRSRPSAPPPSC